MQLNELLQLIDKDLENTQDKLMEMLGGDPGHDIGDSGNALELLSNVVTERDLKSRTEFGDALCKILNLNRHSYSLLYDELKNLSSEQWSALHNDLYPGVAPYSGFGPAW